MKKRIIYFALAVAFAFSVFNFSSIKAEELNINQMINSTTMPTDEEIMATIRQFNFDKSQEEYLFKETKKKLNEMYSQIGQMSKAGATSTTQTTTKTKTQETIKKLPEASKNQNIGQEQEKQAVDSVQNSNNVNNTRTKKYSSHDPLTRRSGR